MSRQAERHPTKAPVRKLRKALHVLADTPPDRSYEEAEQYICSVCNLPVKPCASDARAKCFHMLKESTELQILFNAELETHHSCLSCGRTLSRRWLLKNPTAELCSTCTKNASSSRNRNLSKGSPS